MSVIDILAGIGRLKAKAEKFGVHIDVLDEVEKVADIVVKHVASNPASGLTAEQAHDKIQTAKAECLAAGDEAQARLDTRKADDDGA